MWEIRVVIVDPLVECDLKVKRVIPVIAPDDIFFDGAHDTFGIRVALGIRPGGEYLLDPHHGAVHHEALGRGLAAVVRD